MNQEKQAIRQLGKRVRALRLTRGWSQEELAVEAKLDRGYVGRIERGETNLTIRNIVRIADALKVSVGELFLTCPPVKKSKLPNANPAPPRTRSAAHRKREQASDNRITARKPRDCGLVVGIGKYFC